MWKNLYNNQIYTMFKAVTFILLLSLWLSVFPAELIHAEESTDNPTESPQTVIETGDATTGNSTINEINTNTTNVGTEVEEEEPATASSTEEEVETEIETGTTTENGTTTEDTTLLAENGTTTASSTTTTTATTTIEINNENVATTTNQATSTAVTGENTVSGGDGGTNLIVSGHAIAYADILNVLNTNITNSDGLVSFINEVLGYQNFDLRSDFETIFNDFETALSTIGCSLSVCGDNSIYYSVNNNNTAIIENNVSVTANTGNNTASGSSAGIQTGNAHASANIVNVANTNITDSNYMLLVFNNFASYAGDIVLPNSSFFNKLFGHGGSMGNIQVENHNSAEVNNNVVVNANTGNNSTSNGGTIITGNANAQSNIDNLINTNIFAGSSFSMLIRVHGEWDGEIFGLPDNVGWIETSDGIRLFSTAATGGNGLATQANYVHNQNQASIKNNVQVYALTGENEINAKDEATIVTGNASADATILNIANTNVIGSNWANLVFNIYGNWNGNLSFGQSDLWLGMRAESPDNPIMPDSAIAYTFTVFNRGDSTAHDVELKSLFDAGTLSFATLDNTLNNSASHQTWSLGNIAAGETKEITYQAAAGAGLPKNVVSVIPLQASVSSYEPDANIDDNEDEVIVYVGRERGSHNPINATFNSKFEIVKTADKKVINPGDTVNYTIRIINHGGPMFDGTLFDSLYDSNQNAIVEQNWPLGDVETNEEIVVEYSLEFDLDTEPGVYTNVAQVLGYTGSRQAKYQTEYDSPVASHKIEVSEINGEVLGVSTSVTNCPRYLSTYMRSGADNDPEEVERLQIFLNNFGEVGIAVTSEFDLPTEIAVRNFQQKYETDILGPWGLNNDSGYVYYTTQKKINEMACENQVAFPLSPQQEQEIAYFKQGNRLALADSSRPSIPNLPQPVVPPATLIAGLKNHTQVENKIISETAPETDLMTTTPKQTKLRATLFTKIKNWLRYTSVSFVMSLK